MATDAAPLPLHHRSTHQEDDPQYGDPTTTTEEEIPSIPISKLFDVTRMTRPIGIWHVIFWIYAPFGLVFFLLRLLWIALWEVI